MKLRAITLATAFVAAAASLAAPAAMAQAKEQYLPVLS